MKANALYRDNSKLSQPLNTKSDAEVDDDEEDADEVDAARSEVSDQVAEAAHAIAAANIAASQNLVEPTYVERIVERIIERPMRRRLPDTRHSITHHFNVAGHEGYLTVGMYDDHSPGELFITMSKEGSTIGGLMDSLGTAISVALQYGVPIESLVTKFAHQRFEPMGMTTNHDIPFAKSLVDYIFRWMGMEFISGYREANAPPRSKGGKVSQETKEVAAAPAKEDRTWSKSEDSESSGLSASTSRITGQISRTIETGREKIDAIAAMARSGGSAGERREAPIVEVMHAERTTKTVTESTVTMVNPLDQSNAALMGDAPACDGCGSITVRNGSCYKCMNCGNSMGCS